MKISFRFRNSVGRAISAAVEADEIEVTTLGDTLPRYEVGHVRFGLQMSSFDDFVAAVQALAPRISVDELRRLIDEQTTQVGRVMVGR